LIPTCLKVASVTILHLRGAVSMISSITSGYGGFQAQVMYELLFLGELRGYNE
jgi:hypothetical protein